MLLVFVFSLFWCKINENIDRIGGKNGKKGKQIAKKKSFRQKTIPINEDFIAIARKMLQESFPISQKCRIFAPQFKMSCNNNEIDMIKSTKSTYIGDNISTGGVGITGNITVATPHGIGV